MSEHDVINQIRAHAPAAARAYFIWNHSGRYPSQGGFSLDPISTPFGLQPGEYRIAYLPEVASNIALQARSVANPTPTIRISASDGQALAVAPAPTDKGSKTSAAQRDPIEDDPEHLRNRVEFEAIRMADQTVTNQHLVAKRLVKNRELGELLVYARAHRQELEQNLRLMSDMGRSMLNRANETAQLIEARRGPEEQTGPFVGILGQLLQLLNSAVSGSKGKGETILDALVGGDDEDKLAAVLKELASLKRKAGRAHKAKEDDGKKSRKPAKTKKSAQSAKSAKKTTSGPPKGSTQTKGKSSARKQLPARKEGK